MFLMCFIGFYIDIVKTSWNNKKQNIICSILIEHVTIYRVFIFFLFFSKLYRFFLCDFCVISKGNYHLVTSTKENKLKHVISISMAKWLCFFSLFNLIKFSIFLEQNTFSFAWYINYYDELLKSVFNKYNIGNCIVTI